MYMIRMERRNRQGRVTTVLEKEFDSIYGTRLTRWLNKELNEAIYAHDTVTITNLTPEEDN